MSGVGVWELVSELGRGASPRPTDLFFRDPHVLRDVGEDGRLDEVPLVALPLSPAHQARPLLHPGANQLQNLLHLSLVHLTHTPHAVMDYPASYELRPMHAHPSRGNGLSG